MTSIRWIRSHQLYLRLQPFDSPLRCASILPPQQQWSTRSCRKPPFFVHSKLTSRQRWDCFRFADHTETFVFCVTANRKERHFSAAQQLINDHSERAMAA